VKAGGSACVALGGLDLGHRVLDFPAMRHGWTVRGDIAEPAVADAVADAMEAVAAHFDQHLKGGGK